MSLSISKDREDVFSVLKEPGCQLEGVGVLHAVDWQMGSIRHELCVKKMDCMIN